MPKSRVIVLSVVQQGPTKAEAARKFGVTWRWVHELVTRYERDGDTGLAFRSRAPDSNSNQTPPEVRDHIIELRTELGEEGFDAGPESIWDRLIQSGLPAPSRSTVARILKREGLVIPEPKKRPKSSYIRFEANQPNETW